MHASRVVEMILHIPRRLVRELLGFAQLTPLYLINRFGRSPVTQQGAPVVSLTTYGQRVRTVYLALESIARGEIRPSRLILWIDEDHLFHNLPVAVRRLQKRGLEVRKCKNYGPHKKYYPYVESLDAFDLPLVTADDDILYPRYWLKKLLDAYREYSEVINCYFAGDVKFDKTTGEMQICWKSCHSCDSSYCYHPLGGTGVIYPPGYLKAVKYIGRKFEDICPMHDDVWHHVVAIRAGYKVRQILPLPPYFSFQSIPGTNQTASGERGVDREIVAAYKQSDIELLRAEHDAMHR